MVKLSAPPKGILATRISTPSKFNAPSSGEKIVVVSIPAIIFIRAVNVLAMSIGIGS